MKLFVTDYDGTLYIGDNELKKTIKLLKKLQKKDYLIVIATGRSYPSIKNQTIIHSIPHDYLSCADGSITFDKDGNILNSSYMDKEIIKPLEHFYQKLNYEEIQFSYPEGYANILKDDDKLLGINICLSTENYTKDLVDNFMKISNHYPNYSYLDYMHPHFSYLCVKPKGISKSSSVKYLMDINNISQEDVYVIGDSANDYEMISDFNGVCVNESYPEILAIAKKKYKVIDDYIYELLKED